MQGSTAADLSLERLLASSSGIPARQGRARRAGAVARHPRGLDNQQHPPPEIRTKEKVSKTSAFTFFSHTTKFSLFDFSKTFSDVIIRERPKTFEKPREIEAAAARKVLHPKGQQRNKTIYIVASTCGTLGRKGWPIMKKKPLSILVTYLNGRRVNTIEDVKDVFDLWKLCDYEALRAARVEVSKEIGRICTDLIVSGGNLYAICEA